MNKKIAIAVAILIIVLAIGAGVWRWKEKNNEKNFSEQQTNKNGQNDSSILNEKLVWYGVPELGIKFKVTPDEKEDLKYIVYKDPTELAESDYLLVTFYNQSVYDFQKQLASDPNYSCRIENNRANCYVFILMRKNEELLKNEKKNEKDGGLGLCMKKIISVKSNIICEFPSLTSDFSTEDEYIEYLNWISSKDLHYYLNTVELL